MLKNFLVDYDSVGRSVVYSDKPRISDHPSVEAELGVRIPRTIGSLTLTLTLTLTRTHTSIFLRLFFFTQALVQVT